MTSDKPLLPISKEQEDSLETTLRELTGEIRSSSLKKRNDRYKDFIDKKVIVVTTAIEKGLAVPYSMPVFGTLDKETDDDVHIRDGAYELNSVKHRDKYLNISKNQIIIMHLNE